MWIKMKKDKLGAEQGIHVKNYKKDEVYETSDELGTTLIDCGAAEASKAPKASAKKEEDKKDK